MQKDASLHRQLAREHPLLCFGRDWWSTAGSLAFALLLVERVGVFGGRMDVRTALIVVLATGALSSGARVIGLYWTERRRVARGDT